MKINYNEETKTLTFTAEHPYDTIEQHHLFEQTEEKHPIEHVVIQGGTIGDDAFSYYRNIKDVVIEGDVGSIGAKAFECCTALESVSVNGSLRVIDAEAFVECNNLRTITLGDSLERIGEYAFCGCESLKDIVIPDSVTWIEKNVFSDCSSLGSIKMSDRIEIVESDAFGGTAFARDESNWKDGALYVGKALVAVSQGDIPIGCNYEVREGTRVISDYAFSGCGIESITLPDTIQYIGDEAFESCGALTAINLPNSIKGIYDGTFARCDSLESIDIPDSVKYIGSYAFAGCENLKEVVLPESLEYIGEGAFEGVDAEFVAPNEDIANLLTDDVMGTYDYDEEEHDYDE